jgi:hypothetical protein
VRVRWRCLNCIPAFFPPPPTSASRTNSISDLMAVHSACSLHRQPIWHKSLHCQLTHPVILSDARCRHFYR